MSQFKFQTWQVSISVYHTINQRSFEGLSAALCNERVTRAQHTTEENTKKERKNAAHSDTDGPGDYHLN